tara:strand:+ start:5446 stop:7716 length:2271 start_codon:yes stop_codon:yes gene_type:complete
MTLKYDPQKVTDWLTPLEKVYARQSQQLDLYHEQLRERDRQEEAAKTAITLPEVAHKLKGFSQTIRTITDARETNLQTKAQYVYDSANADEQEIINQLAEQRKLDKNHTEFTARVNKTDLADTYKHFLTSRNGGNLVRVDKIRGQEFIENWPTTFKNMLDSDEHKNLLDQYHLDKDDPVKLKALLKSELIKGLKGIGLTNEKFLIANYGKSIDKLADTKAVLEGIKSKNVIFEVDEAANARIVNASVFALGEGQGDAVAQGAQTLILEGVNKNKGVDLTKSIDNTAEFYYQLGLSGKFSNEALEALRSGKIEGHAAGDTGNILFSEKQFKKIQQGINEYNTAYLAASDAANKQGLIAGTVAFKKTGNVAARDLVLSGYIRNGGKTSDDGYKELENAKKYDADIAQIETERVGEIQLTGRPGQYTDEVKAMSQVEFDTWEDGKNLYEANREQNGVDKKTSDTFATNLMKADLGLDVSPLGKGLIPGTQTEIRDWISARRDQIYATVYNDPKQDRKTIRKTTDALLKDELTQMGFYAPNDREHSDYGILTSDGQGGYPGWEAKEQSKIERTKGTNPQRTVRNLINELKEHKTIANLLKNGKGITNAELLAVIDNIQDGKLTAFPPDVLLKARIYGKQPSTLVLSKLEYLKNTNAAKGDKDFVKRFNLDLETLTKSIPSTDIQIREVLKGINDGRTLLSYYNKRGIGGLSPNQLNYIIREADKQRVTAQKEKEELEKEVKETRKMQTPDTQIGRYNTRS